jgi:hypothetical protein
MQPQQIFAIITVLTVEQLTTVLHAQPFRPFTIHRGDGRTFFVKHPDFLSRSETGRTVIVQGPHLRPRPRLTIR